MAIILSHGLETNAEFNTRLSFMVDHRALWSFGWLTWTAAALSFLYFCDAFAAAHDLHRFAVLLTAAAVVADITGHTMEIALLPAIAGRVLRSEGSPELFLLLHRIVVLLSGYVANTLYSLSTLFLSWSSRHFYPRRIPAAGLAVAFVGFGLSIAALAGSTAGLLWTNAVLIVLLLLWLGLLIGVRPLVPLFPSGK